MQISIWGLYNGNKGKTRLLCCYSTIMPRGMRRGILYWRVLEKDIRRRERSAEALTRNSIGALMLIPLTHYIWGPDCVAVKILAGISIPSWLLLVSSVWFWVVKVKLLCQSVVLQFKQENNSETKTMIPLLMLWKSLIAYYIVKPAWYSPCWRFGWFVFISLTAGRYFRHHS